MPNGLLVGGSDRGVISMYDVHKLIKGEKSLGKKNQIIGEIKTQKNI